MIDLLEFSLSIASNFKGIGSFSCDNRCLDQKQTNMESKDP